MRREFNVDGPRIEALRFGNAGHTTYQELEFLCLYGAQHQPSLVVLGFVFNDVYYKYLHRATGSRFIDREPTLKLQRFDTRSLPGSLLRRSYLAHELHFGFELLYKQALRRPEFPFENEDDLYLAWKPYGWDATQRLIGEMVELSREHGSELVAVIFPVRYQFEEQYREIDLDYLLYPQTRAKEVFRSHGTLFSI